MEQHRWKRGENPVKATTSGGRAQGRACVPRAIPSDEETACPGCGVAYQASAQGKLHAVLIAG